MSALARKQICGTAAHLSRAVVTSCSRSRNIRKNQARRRNSDQDQRRSTGNLGDKGGDEEQSDSATGDAPHDTAPVGNRRP
jgi:hypothetical protein